MSRTIHTDIAILGGGICGLWLLNLLRRKGYRALLLEKEALGEGQTIASQGMIHGGIKYTLQGFTTDSSETIAAMPALWRDCLAGTGPVNLEAVERLSEDYYLFSDDSLTSRLAAFFGSKSLRGRIAQVSRADYPTAFDHPSFKGALYRLQDIVLDTTSLVSALHQQVAPYVFKANATLVSEGGASALVLEDGSRISARYYILAAGAGNEDILSTAKLDGIRMQRRPLHQVMLKSARLPRLYAHAVSLQTGATPRVTITTHPAGDGERVWYLGGAVAETGVHRGENQQVAFARAELQSLFPWIPLTDARWATFRIDRAEPAQNSGGRPDEPFASAIGNVIVCWPTKLTLAPMLADRVLDLLGKPEANGDEQLPALRPARVATPPWERLF